MPSFVVRIPWSKYLKVHVEEDLEGTKFGLIVTHKMRHDLCNQRSPSTTIEQGNREEKEMILTLYDGEAETHHHKVCKTKKLAYRPMYLPMWEKVCHFCR